MCGPHHKGQAGYCSALDGGSFLSNYLLGILFKDRHPLNLSELKCLKSSGTCWINLEKSRTLRVVTDTNKKLKVFIL